MSFTSWEKVNNMLVCQVIWTKGNSKWKLFTVCYTGINRTCANSFLNVYYFDEFVNVGLAENYQQIRIDSEKAFGF